MATIYEITLEKVNKKTPPSGYRYTPTLEALAVSKKWRMTKFLFKSSIEEEYHTPTVVVSLVNNDSVTVLRLLIDTGCYHTLLKGSIIREVQLQVLGDVLNYGVRPSGEVMIGHRFKGVIIINGEEKTLSADCQIFPCEENFSYDGILGTQFMADNNLRLVFSPGENLFQLEQL